MTASDPQPELPFELGSLPPPPPALPVEIVRSRRRRKTVEAIIVDGKIEVRVPASMSEADSEQYATELVDRLQRRHRSDRIDLARRAKDLADRLGLPSATSVEWSERQQRRWASCSPATGAIRVSIRAADLPPWVTDYLLVHELAHLLEPNHSADFWTLCERYPLTERARGYLIACDYLAEENQSASR